MVDPLTGQVAAAVPTQGIIQLSWTTGMKKSKYGERERKREPGRTRINTAGAGAALADPAKSTACKRSQGDGTILALQNGPVRIQKSCQGCAGCAEANSSDY